jgi:hypothetical protein
VGGLVKKPYPYVHEIIDRHGHPRAYQGRSPTAANRLPRFLGGLSCGSRG